MADLELVGALIALKQERSRVQNELAVLDKVITAIADISRTKKVTPHGNGRRRTLSAAARNSIAKAQRLRWAKWKKEHAAKG